MVNHLYTCSCFLRSNLLPPLPLLLYTSFLFDFVYTPLPLWPPLRSLLASPSLTSYRLFLFLFGPHFGVFFLLILILHPIFLSDPITSLVLFPFVVLFLLILVPLFPSFGPPDWLAIMIYERWMNGLSHEVTINISPIRYAKPQFISSALPSAVPAGAVSLLIFLSPPLSASASISLF